MKAYVLRDIGKIELVDTDKPVLKMGEALVKVRAAGICGSDIPRIYSTGAHTMPIIPGHEFSGEVVDTYSEKDKFWHGKRVGIFPLIPCGKCENCKNKRYEMCKSYSYLGSRQNGGFAEYVNVPIWNLIELPKGVSFEEAAMLEPLAVAIHAIRTAIKNEDRIEEKRIIVSGLGTIGLMIVAVLKVFGIADICGIGNKNYQREQLKVFGVSEYYDSYGLQQDDIPKADMVFECVGSNESINNAIELTKEAGCIMYIGNPKTDVMMPRDIYWQILRKQLTVRGTWNSSYTKEDSDDWHLAIDFLEKRKIDLRLLISHRFSIDELINGVEIMHSKSENYTKVCGVFE